MKQVLLLVSVAILVCLFGCQAATSNTTTVAGDQTTADQAANEIGYGVESDEGTTASSTSVRAVVSETSTVSGLNGGSVSYSRNTTWTDQGTGTADPGTGLTSPDTSNNRYWTYYGSQTVTFSNYSNVAGRTISSGSVTATIASTSPANFQSTTSSVTFAGTVPNSANYSSSLGTNQVQHTVNGVTKTVSGIVTVLRNGYTYTCDTNLTVTVNYRVTFWTYSTEGTFTLSSPVVKTRSSTVTGTIKVNGTTFNVNRTLVTAVS